MSGRLEEKVVIVTGAGCVGPGWGNGRAVAVRFAEEGAKIFAVDTSADAMRETLELLDAVGGQYDSTAVEYAKKNIRGLVAVRRH